MKLTEFIIKIEPRKPKLTNFLMFFLLYRLQFVSVANIYSLTDQTMRAIAAYTGPNLIALDIRGCWRITDQGIAVVAEYCPNLRVLNITDCR